MDYTFDKNRKRVKSCPCGRSNSDGKFTPYIGFDTKGYCHSCLKTFLPDKPYNFSYVPRKIKPKKIDFIPNEITQNISNNFNDNFSLFLRGIFGENITKKLIKKYNIGYTDKFRDATVFWQNDINNRLRSGKIIFYNQLTGKRDKSKNINWIHSIYKLSDYALNQSLFGEHLLNLEPNKKVALVESEKTAIICSVVFPEFLWLATGGSAGLKLEKLKVLNGKDIILFPDLGFHSKWMAELTLLAEYIYFKSWIVSDYLEKNANKDEVDSGYDLADFVLMNIDSETGWLLNEYGYPLFWDNI